MSWASLAMLTLVPVALILPGPMADPVRQGVQPDKVALCQAMTRVDRDCYYSELLSTCQCTDPGGRTTRYVWRTGGGSPGWSNRPADLKAFDRTRELGLEYKLNPKLDPKLTPKLGPNINPKLNPKATQQKR